MNTPTKYHVPVEQAANLVTTIRNLRELATHAENFPEHRLDMKEFRGDPDDPFDQRVRGEKPDKYYCGTTCCLIGIADACGMGAEIPCYGWYWEQYWQQLFPYLAYLEYLDEYPSPFVRIFGGHLKNNISIRVLNLHLAADMLERTGQLDYERLLS